MCRHDSNTSIKRQLIITAGGPAASFVFACIIFFCFPLFDGEGKMRGGPFILLYSSLAIFFLTIIPRNKRTVTVDGNVIYNDGHRLRKLWRLRKYEQEYSTANDAFADKDYAKAVDLFEQLWNKKIKVQEIFTYTMAAMLMAKQYERALSFCRKIASTSSLNEDDYCLISLAGIHNKLHKEALIALKLSLGLNPRHYNSLNNIGYVYTVTGEFNTAIEYLDNAIEVNPLSGYAYCNRGYARVKTGNLEGGYEDIQRSMQLNNTNVYVYRNLGIYYMHLNEFDKALPQLIKAKELDADTDMIDELIAETQNNLQKVEI